MNYYPFHVGDYVTHTAHLSHVEDIAYRRLLDLYYINEEPLPADVPTCARKIRMREFEAEVAQVLGEFFTLTESGWVNVRCEEELAVMRAKQEKARASAFASVKARQANAQRAHDAGITDAQRTLNERSTTVELPTPTPTPTPTPEKGNIYPPDFEAIWSAYPTRPGGSKQGAFRAWKSRIKAGVSNDDMLDGVRRYAAFVRETGTQPQYVKHAATFLGPDEHYRSDWTPTRNAPTRQTIHDERKATLDALTGRSTSNGQFDIIDV